MILYGIDNIRDLFGHKVCLLAYYRCTSLFYSICPIVGCWILVSGFIEILGAMKMMGTDVGELSVTFHLISSLHRWI